MYQLENIIRTATRSSDDKLNIIVMCDNEEDYISALCQTGHNFFLFTEQYHLSQWKREVKHTPLNLRICRNPLFSFERAYDLIICFNRLGQWETASGLSRAWHIPIVTVDIVSNATKLQHPFFANLSIDNPEAMYQRGGIVTVGSSKSITQGWTSTSTSVSTTIPIPHNPIERKVNPRANTKIAVDKDLPEEYIKSLPLALTDIRFTTSLSEAAFYLHLWQTITPKMLEAMALGIPVVTLKSSDFDIFLEKGAIIIIENLNSLMQPDIVQQILEFDKTQQVIENALSIATEGHSPDKFVQLWNDVFNYARNSFYLRG